MDMLSFPDQLHPISHMLIKHVPIIISCSGYMPPEYINHKIISKEFDIFSLGVIIIKIMMGSAGYFLISDMEPDKFIEHVRKIIVRNMLLCTDNIYVSISRYATNGRKGYK